MVSPQPHELCPRHLCGHLCSLDDTARGAIEILVPVSYEDAASLHGGKCEPLGVAEDRCELEPCPFNREATGRNNQEVGVRERGEARQHRRMATCLPVYHRAASSLHALGDPIAAAHDGCEPFNMCDLWSVRCGGDALALESDVVHALPHVLHETLSTLCYADGHSDGAHVAENVLKRHGLDDYHLCWRQAGARSLYVIRCDRTYTALLLGNYDVGPQIFNHRTMDAIDGPTGYGLSPYHCINLR
mmetsp:Transcript_9786/g.21290  ORF Transcript_9786/g.21290 Transcript_9786/m.21290 type:complete len:245 (-) Transcript_9786:185-919(-)